MMMMMMVIMVMIMMMMMSIEQLLQTLEVRTDRFSFSGFAT
jgi:hypothetical protein